MSGMSTDDVLADLADRTEKGISAVHVLAGEPGLPGDERRRLMGKAEGMRVVLDYLRAYSTPVEDRSSWDNAKQVRLIECRDVIHAALLTEMDSRGQDPDVWILAEQDAMVSAANRWAAVNGQRAVTLKQVQQVDRYAAGHIDYAMKVALYVAECVMGVRG